MNDTQTLKNCIHGVEVIQVVDPMIDIYIIIIQSSFPVVWVGYTNPYPPFLSIKSWVIRWFLLTSFMSIWSLPLLPV